MAELRALYAEVGARLTVVTVIREPLSLAFSGFGYNLPKEQIKQEYESITRQPFTKDFHKLFRSGAETASRNISIAVLGAAFARWVSSAGPLQVGWLSLVGYSPRN